MPPSRTGIYSNFTPVRCSIAGMTSWLRKALGLPKSNMNCGAVGFTAVSLRTVSYMIPIIPTSLAVHVRGINWPILRVTLKRCFGEYVGLVAHIRGPGGDQFSETGRVICEQRADGVFVMGLVAGHRRHETIGRFLRPTDAITILAGSARAIDQFAQGDRSPAGLLRQPVPVPRQ